LVLLIYKSRHIAQIINPVIRLDAVDVVNLGDRPYISHVQPCQPMCVVSAAGDRYCAVAGCGSRTSNGTHPAGAAAPLSPRKNAGFWSVVKKFAQSLRGKIGLSHEAVLSLIGQRPAGVTSAVRALSF
jgi:hypothetical protein